MSHYEGYEVDGVYFVDHFGLGHQIDGVYFSGPAVVEPDAVTFVFACLTMNPAISGAVISAAAVVACSTLNPALNATIKVNE
ncbi:MAG: hypothetical protein OEW37_00135 [Rhodospirillaceae bacterium]|nr:hypothetical protein [Rhodospirillaceae bacterium]